MRPREDKIDWIRPTRPTRPRFLAHHGLSPNQACDFPVIASVTSFRCETASRHVLLKLWPNAIVAPAVQRVPEIARPKLEARVEQRVSIVQAVDAAAVRVEPGAVVEPHSIPGTNITSAVPTAPISADKTDRSDALATYITRIAFPSSESTIPMGPGDFVVEAGVSPGLENEEQLILLLDGEAVGTPQSFPRWQLTNVFRGAHRLQVVRVSKTGAAQSQSTEHTVYVMRPTVNR